MASRFPTIAADDRSQDYTVPSYNPSDYYMPRAAPVDYYAPVAPLSENPLLELRRPINKDACFAVSAVSPGLPTRRAGGRDSAASILLDRFLGHQKYSPRVPETPRTPAHHVHSQGTMASMKSPGWVYTQTPVTPGNPRSVWSFMSQGQYIPPPPPGPPPSEGRLSRMHSVVKEIVVPPIDDRAEPETISTDAASCAFRQPARGQAPKPLRDREIASAVPKVPSYPIYPPTRFASPPMSAVKPSMVTKRPKPAPIDVQLAEGKVTGQPAKSAPIQRHPASIPDDIQRARDEAAAKLQGIHSPPQTAGVLTSLRHTRANPVSPNRGVPLSPLNTQITKSVPQKGVLVDVVLSPSLSPLVANPRSPLSLGRNTRSPSPSLWSPETPVAMSFDFPIIISDSTPPLQALEWLADRPRTIIEEDMQEETPHELLPPRGRISGHPSPPRVRARSMSPPMSAYPTESSFNWDKVDIENRHATDEDFEEALHGMNGQMMEAQSCRSQSHGFNPRQTILGSYFGH